MYRSLIPFLFLATWVTFAACKKTGTGPSNILVGTWVFTHQQTATYAYPSVLVNRNPLSVGQQSVSFDSIRVSFFSDGSYTFSNFRLPTDKGTYTLSGDSLLIIHPDTAGFLKFNYTMPQVNAGPVPPVSSGPAYAGFQFTTDTIGVHIENGQAIFLGAWITSSAMPLIPSGDTLVLNEVINYFTRK